MNAAWVAREDVRLLVVDPARPAGRAIAGARFAELARFVRPGDLVVVNDAATLPASLAGVTAWRAPVELRLLGAPDGGRVRAVLLGAGDHRTRTEDRPPPPRLAPGDTIYLGAGAARLDARIVRVSDLSPRLVELDLGDDPDRVWAALYGLGRPIQYAYRPEPLPLWAVQTAYGGRPWAAEMPSAGRPLTWDVLLAIRRRGAGLAALTHAAGLSSTGDPAIDAALPLAERYDIPAVTARAVAATRRHRGRVIAVGTTVVRALESAADERGRVRAGAGVAELIVTPAYRPRVVDGIVSGIHAPDQSHFRLLGALAGPDVLAAAAAGAAAGGYRDHELGDACLILPGALADAAAAAAA
jgi:S-adenosylmethionine:tRNA ribosyltransferase-isomerase